jgi:HEAT repeat protein
LLAKYIILPDVCVVALDYLVKVNSAESRNLLKEALVKSSPENLYQVLDAITQIPDDSFIPAIVPILSNTDEKTRIKAIQTLVKVNPQKAVPILVKRLIEAQETSDCNAIKQALLQTPSERNFIRVREKFEKVRRR